MIFPHENDILMGRGGTNNMHVGNQQFRMLAKQRLFQYSACSRKEKPHIYKALVMEVFCLKPPGRFLKKDKKSGRWTRVSFEMALEKASRTLRDAVAAHRSSGGDLQDVEGVEGVSSNKRSFSMIDTLEKSVSGGELERRKVQKRKIIDKFSTDACDESHGGTKQLNSAEFYESLLRTSRSIIHSSCEVDHSIVKRVKQTSCSVVSSFSSPRNNNCCYYGTTWSTSPQNVLYHEDGFNQGVRPILKGFTCNQRPENQIFSFVPPRSETIAARIGVLQDYHCQHHSTNEVMWSTLTTPSDLLTIPRRSTTSAGGGFVSYKKVLPIEKKKNNHPSPHSPKNSEVVPQTLVDSTKSRKEEEDLSYIQPWWSRANNASRGPKQQEKNSNVLEEDSLLFPRTISFDSINGDNQLLMNQAPMSEGSIEEETKEEDALDLFTYESLMDLFQDDDEDEEEHDDGGDTTTTSSTMVTVEAGEMDHSIPEIVDL